MTTRKAESPTAAALRKAKRSLGDLLWLGNNLHNHASPTFRKLFASALPEARAAYNEAARLLGEEEAPG